jgi:16S rRNA processing protein RimM
VLSAVKDSRLYLGRFVKAFGIKGELKLLTSDDFWAGVLESQELTLQWIEDGDVLRRPVFVERARQHGGTFVVKIEGVDDRSEAEAAVGQELFVDIERLDVELPDQELPYQTIGMDVRTEDGEAIGKVTSFVYSAAHNVYEVTGENGVVLIPAVEPFVVRRDDERGEIVIRPIPGLLDD